MEAGLDCHEPSEKTSVCDAGKVFVMRGTSRCIFVEYRKVEYHATIESCCDKFYVDICQSVETKTFEIARFQFMSGGHEYRCH
jgi:hypothetical protein